MKAEAFFDLTDVGFAENFLRDDPLWEVLRPRVKETRIRETLKGNVHYLDRKNGLVMHDQEIQVDSGTAMVRAGAYIIDDDIQIHAGCVVESGAYVAGPTILGPGTLIRHGAYVRGGVITGKECVIGHASEVKSSIFLNRAKAAHFAYVGDSILGNDVNLGAGTKISNLKMGGSDVVLKFSDNDIPSGCRKFGAILGDRTETGCNAVLNPGVLTGRDCVIYPTISVRNQHYADGLRIRA